MDLGETEIDILAKTSLCLALMHFQIEMLKNFISAS
jgi:hypothetical protein